VNLCLHGPSTNNSIKNRPFATLSLQILNNTRPASAGLGRISAPGGLLLSILNSFMHHLTNVRNLVAHHGRLWNRRRTVTLSIPYRPKEIAGLFNPQKERNIYNTLVILGYLLNIMSPGTTWPARVWQLLEENPAVNPVDMGFPLNWKELSFWKGTI
jgi:abortive infection bacteriophage resistance protein